MSNNFNSNIFNQMLKPYAVSNIPADMTPEEAVNVFLPKEFEDMVSLRIGDNGNLVMTFLQAENAADNEVEIYRIFFNPSFRDVRYPKFLFQISTLRVANYFGSDSKLVLNQNQMLYLIIHNRLTSLKQYQRIFVGLLRSDLKDLRTYTEYSAPVSYNAKQKIDNCYVIVDAWDQYTNINSLVYHKNEHKMERPIGEILRPSRVDAIRRTPLDVLMKAVTRDVPIQPGSEKMMADGNKLIISVNENMYRAPGYHVKKEGGTNILYSIFEGKQNMPARLKTHILADAFSFTSPVTKTIIQQDSIKIEEDIKPKDDCLNEGVVVFMPIDVNTGRFVCGEIEQSLRTARHGIKRKDQIAQQFKTISVKVGDVFSGNEARRVKIGTDLDDEIVYVSGEYTKVRIVDIEEDAINSSYRIRIECEGEQQSNRMTTHTGIKGFTKVRPNLGYIVMPDGKKISVDFALGMNSVKGKMNTIMLARASMALREGLYTTANDFINSLNIEQVNEAAKKMPQVKYIDENGKEHKVWAGVIQYSVTEIAKMYSTAKPQSFSFEAGKFLEQQEDNKLFRHIWAEYIEHDKASVAIELHKILEDSVGIYAHEEKLPVWQPMDLKKVFSSKDIIISTMSRWASNSVLLDESVNKGWYLDLSHFNGPMVRMPSAKLLNTFCSQMSNGEYMFPTLAVNIGKILQNCIEANDRGNYNYGFLWSQDQTRRTSVSMYLNSVRGMLYTEKEIGMVLSQTFLKPKIFGMGTKQMVDIHLPKGVVVVLDEMTHWKFREIALGVRDNHGKVIQDKKHDDAYKQGMAGAVGDVLLHDGGSPIRGLAIRNPMLWRSQIQNVEIWGRDRFENHLKNNCGIELNEYLSVSHCKNLILISVMDAIIQHSDIDGDLLPLFVPNVEGQKILENFVLGGISKEEAQWTLDYYMAEASANDDLYKEPVYKLYKTPMQYNSLNPKTYCEFFINACIAKNNIGSATNDIWALYAVMQIYRACLEEPELKERYLQKFLDATRTAPRELTQEAINVISYLYTRLVEEYVINAIKHMEGGSSSFTVYYLRNMTQTDENATLVATKLAAAPFNMDKKMISILMDIVHWSTDTGVLDAVKNFIGKYNKGKKVEQSDLDSTISRVTYIGGLTKPMYDITVFVAGYKQKGYRYKYTKFVAWHKAVVAKPAISKGVTIESVDHRVIHSDNLMM